MTAVPFLSDFLEQHKASVGGCTHSLIHGHDSGGAMLTLRVCVQLEPLLNPSLLSNGIIAEPVHAFRDLHPLRQQLRPISSHRAQ